MIDRVLDEGADLGIAWDGDADRCFFIDDTGVFVAGDFLTALLAGQLLDKRHGARILYDVRAKPGGSRHCARARRRGLLEPGRPRLLQDRHARARRGVRRRGLRPLLLPRLLRADLGTLPALLVLELISVSGRSLSDLVGAFREHYYLRGDQPEVDDQDAKMRVLAERHADAEIDWLDGVSVDYEDWHFNVRLPNTEPLLRLNLESLVSREDMEKKRDEVPNFIRV